MSAASERARALLAAVKARGFGTGSLHGYDGWKLLADACSPEGGILATLAGEVERLTDATAAGAFCPIHRAGDHVVMTTEDASALIDENARLRAALEAMRRRHGQAEDPADPGEVCPKVDGRARRSACTCGADAHNARIDAALKGEGG